MNKLCTVILLASGFISSAYAAQNPGYIFNSYGDPIRDTYGKCVHTAYYDPNNGIAACGEGPTPPPVAAAPPPPPAPTVVIETVTLSDADDVLFNFNAASLSSHGTSVLSGFTKKYSAESDVTKITINGYTDGIGKPDYNMKLSQGRADAVKQYFIANGMPASKVTATGLGSKDDAKSQTCFSQMGGDKINQIYAAQDKLKAKKFKGKKLSKKVASEKKSLQANLSKLQDEQTKLIACTAPDRRVVFTIEHTQQVEKTIPAAAASSNASAPAPQ